MMSRWW